MLEAEALFQPGDTTSTGGPRSRRPPVVMPMADSEKRSISFADADGWRCFYPRTRGHLTAAEARAAMRRERGMRPETPEEAAAAEFILVVGPETF